MKRNLTLILIIALFWTTACIDVYGAAEYDQSASDNIVDRIEEYVEPYLGTDTLNNYDNGRAIQCHAFTNYVWRNVFGYDVYSSKCRRTEASNDYEKLGEYINKYARPGDMLRVDGKHSMVITSFDENTVTGFDWLYNKKERKCTYTWEGVKEWGDGTQNYWLYQIDDSVYNLFKDSDYKVDKRFGPEPGQKADSNKDSDLKNSDSEEVEQQPSRGEEVRPDYGKIVIQINNPIMTANGTYHNIDSLGTTPVIVNERAVLPIRAIVETMGGTVGWNNDTRTVSLKYKNTNMEMTIDSTTMKVNGKDVQMDVAPMIINERTMLPIRYITENLGGKVEWFDTIQAVAITYER